MKYKLLIFIFFIFSCSPQLKTLNKKKPYSSTGFAYVYNDYDFKDKIILGKLNNEKFQISHQNLKINTENITVLQNSSLSRSVLLFIVSLAIQKCDTFYQRAFCMGGGHSCHDFNLDVARRFCSLVVLAQHYQYVAYRLLDSSKKDPIYGVSSDKGRLLFTYVFC